MNNNEFLVSIKSMYEVYLDNHRRSSAKLLPLHGSIASDLQQRLGSQYKVFSLGFNEGKERNMSGRYMDKKVDISIFKKNGASLEEVGGIAVKAIMTNYAQNSNNYFENMLGETANLRSATKLYFQILILPESVPYFGDKKSNNKKDVIIKHEHLNITKLNKYLKLSNDNIIELLHTPNKTLFCLIKTTDTEIDTNNNPSRADWVNYMKQNLNICLSSQHLNFGNSIIYNNYEQFIEKVVHSVLSI